VNSSFHRCHEIGQCEFLLYRVTTMVDDKLTRRVFSVRVKFELCFDLVRSAVRDV